MFSVSAIIRNVVLRAKTLFSVNEYFDIQFDSKKTLFKINVIFTNAVLIAKNFQ